MPSIAIAAEEGITNRSSCRSIFWAVNPPATMSPTPATTVTPAAILPHRVRGNPSTTRLRKPSRALPPSPARRRTDKSSSGRPVSKSSDPKLSSPKPPPKLRPDSVWTSLRNALATRRGPLLPETYLCSGASSTAEPRFADNFIVKSFRRTPEQGRENRHPNYSCRVRRLLTDFGGSIASGTCRGIGAGAGVRGLQGLQQERSDG